VLIGLATLGAAPPAKDQGAFSETTDVTVVQVPVQVVRDGEPVRGLTAADFDVYEGRKKLAVTGFEVLDLAARQGPAVASIPPALRRHFLLLFDLSFSEPKSIIKARAMVKNMLPALHPSDLVAVATYSSANGPRLVLGFTSDRHQVERAVDTLGLPQLVDRNPDPLQLMMANETAQAVTGSGTTSGRVGATAAGGSEGPFLDLLQNMSRLSDRANREQQAAVVSALVRSFADLAHLMANVRGRKEVIYLSEGFDTAVLQGTESSTEQAQMAELSIEGQAYLTDSDKRYGNTRQANVLEKMMEEFRRSDCIIQSVDIGGVRTGGDQGPTRANGEGALFAMAHDTGGELYRNFNDLGAAMGQLLNKTSITYALTVQPEEVKRDGAYHKLRVELKNSRGAQVFFRPGYYAPKPYSQQTASEKLLATAENVIGGGDSGKVGTSLLVAPFRVEGEKAYVPVVIEAEGGALKAGNVGNVLPTEIYAYAIDSTGAVRDYFTQSLKFDLAKVSPILDKSGLKFFGHLDLPPGEYNIRVLVRNGSTGSYGLRAQPLVVPAFGQTAAVVLLPPFFPEAPGAWLMVREAPRSKDASTAPYPFMVQQRAYIPASRPVLASGQDVAVALVGYNLPAGGLKAEARVLGSDGRDLGTGDLKIGGRENPDAQGEDRLTATFRPPQGLEAGEYQLLIVLTDAQGVAHNSSTRFVVAAVPAGGPAHG
jgi:VWFA-related protein